MGAGETRFKAARPIAEIAGVAIEPEKDAKDAKVKKKGREEKTEVGIRASTGYGAKRDAEDAKLKERTQRKEMD
jgi:hypothetical protein